MFDITLAEWGIILTLNQHPGDDSQRNYPSLVNVENAVNRAIRKLEEAGVITRTRKRYNKRSYELNLTERGQKMFEAILPAANVRYQQIISSWNGQNCQNLLLNLTDCWRERRVSGDNLIHLGGRSKTRSIFGIRLFGMLKFILRYG